MKNHHNNENTTIIKKRCIFMYYNWNTLSYTKEKRRQAGVAFAIKKNIVTKLTEMPRPVTAES